MTTRSTSRERLLGNRPSRPDPRCCPEEWLRTAELRKEIGLDSFILMPNHIHGIIIIKEKGEPKRGQVSSSTGTGRATQRLARTNIQEDSPGIETDRPFNISDLHDIVSGGLKTGTIGAILGQFKSMVSKRINALQGTPGKQIWRRNYYESIIRDGKELEEIRKYIANNPLKWKGR